MQLRCAVLCLSALAASCAGTRGQHFELASTSPAPPTSPASSALAFQGYPSTANLGIVYVEACFYINHEDIFDEDFLDEGIVPVALKLGTRGAGQDTAQISLSPDTMDLHLYLEDGTALEYATAQDVSGKFKKSADEVLQEALRPGLLSRWDVAEEGFVFFRLKPSDDFEVDGTKVEHEITEDFVRKLDLVHSLLGFTISTPDGDRDLYVGLRSDRRVGK